MRPAAAFSSSSRPVAQARNRRSPCSPSSSTAVAASISQTPSHRRFAPAAPRLPASAAALRVFAFQGAATTPSMARPAMASSASVRVEFRVQKRVPFGHTIAVVGVGSPALGGWEVGNSRAALTWTDGDVWTGEVVAERGATLEYKLVALDGAGNPADWQLGENRVVEVKGGDGAGSSRKVVSISVEESWEGGEAAVEVRVEEEEEEKKVVSLPKPTAAAPVANAPAPAAFVQKEPAASVASAAAAAATAAAPVPKPWAASAAAPVAAPAAPSSSPSSPPSLAPRKSLSSLTVPQLKAKLKAAGLPITGKKAELVARLEKGA